MTLIPQRKRKAFAPVLQRELEDPGCNRLDVAVAWVRASGLLHLEDQLVGLLNRGAHARIVVGIDGDNTSEEGLRGLISIAAGAPVGSMELFVRHNEAGSTFHPKLYAFRSAAGCRVFIGSNNLTQSGLFHNEELSVLIRDDLGSQLERDLNDYLVDLTDLSTGLVRKLTEPFLDELVANGYVEKEASLRGKLVARRRTAKTRHPLFASMAVPAPKVSGKPGPVPSTDLEPEGLAVSDKWQGLYLRLRLARGTQAQIPVRVVREIRRRIGLTPQDGVVTIKSRRDGSEHQISPTRAERGHGAVNTYKFEARQVKEEPLLRIYLIGAELFFEFLDSADPLGAPVMALLLEGLKTDPPQTLHTGGAVGPENATWYRFD